MPKSQSPTQKNKWKVLHLFSQVAQLQTEKEGSILVNNDEVSEELAAFLKTLKVSDFHSITVFNERDIIVQSKGKSSVVAFSETAELSALISAIHKAFATPKVKYGIVAKKVDEVAPKKAAKKKAAPKKAVKKKQ